MPLYLLTERHAGLGCFTSFWAGQGDAFFGLLDTNNTSQPPSSKRALFTAVRRH